ncbi:cytochrome c biogenesis protein DipZ [Comamonas thiooxydans]|uniref:Cytochrome c biogenesis protein DipZ n=1 Tax=Comamonas thiooxydans TaxID=363952 RepID=A0AA42Q532_9BURK|nr:MULTISPECIES: cytochrome c biogenesis protein DipZ [Comamonas]EFI60642.1 cytochrome c biogenesis protein [Comamonas thiooxydans]MDH1336299.1 cytochrome c biogenesis protein DipZ [Comamonas thiooxydans]MDH1742204.1 cytochrome c biogenesis protein DipZ [Comamonas thiooxydans]MDH1788760.1 cytochrome c biogenesis protein DipZ [Comamonas thiooxydans]TFF54710.1 cytochrome c biogenesis protein DipZ [Comamonas sp. A23]
MLLIVLAYLGGVLTIVSPCILPVLPFVFSRANQPFVRNGLPLLAGMALTFAIVASLAAVGGGWVVAANQYGRWLALALVAVFGLTLLLPHLSERLTRPLVTAGSRLSESVQQDGTPKMASSVLLGIATGLLWAPCAGPILGLILTGAALQGANTTSTLLLLAYAAGAATSMAAALLLGGRVFAALKRSLGAGEWVRRGLGAAMLAGVAAIALGIDTGVLARLSTASTGGLEQKLVERLNQPHGEDPTTMRGNPGTMMRGASQAPAEGAAMMSAGAAMRMSGPSNKAPALPDEGIAPSLDGATQWLNSKPLSGQDLRGKVVLVDFWTYSCINCLRTLPYVKAWAEKYRDQGLIVVGVHAPEFAFERDIGNVSKAMKDLGINYPVAVDNQYAIWRAFKNQYWPAHYFIDATGRIRHHHFGEGGYAESERVIQQLLQEAGSSQSTMGLTEVDAGGVQLAANMDEVASPETYLGYERAENFLSTPKAVPDRTATYREPERPRLNTWGLAGQWMVGPESALLTGPSGSIVYRFKARDLHLVLSPGPDGKPVRFKVRIDGKPPGTAHGVDVAADGSGTVTGQRLYQLVRQSGVITEHTFSIEFLDSGVSAYAFTFG